MDMKNDMLLLYFELLAELNDHIGYLKPSITVKEPILTESKQRSFLA
jgi:hypothetical protein